MRAQLAASQATQAGLGLFAGDDRGLGAGGDVDSPAGLARVLRVEAGRTEHQAARLRAAGCQTLSVLG